MEIRKLTFFAIRPPHGGSFLIFVIFLISALVPFLGHFSDSSQLKFQPVEVFACFPKPTSTLFLNLNTFSEPLFLYYWREVVQVDNLSLINDRELTFLSEVISETLKLALVP